MNILKQTFKYVFIATITFMFFSCEKQSGEGGSSEITGLVYKLSTYQNALTGQIDTISYQLDSGKDIYIIYSDNESDFMMIKLKLTTLFLIKQL